MQPTIQDVRRFWDSKPLGVGLLHGEVGSKEWFEEFDRIRANFGLFGVLDDFAPAHLRGKRVFDVGCGPGFWARHLTRLSADYVGIDISHATRHADSEPRAPRPGSRRDGGGTDGDEFVRMYDGAGNPIGRAYTTREFRRAFERFFIGNVPPLLHSGDERNWCVAGFGPPGDDEGGPDGARRRAHVGANRLSPVAMQRQGQKANGEPPGAPRFRRRTI